MTAATAWYVKTIKGYILCEAYSHFILIKIALNYSIFHKNVTKFLVIASLNFLFRYTFQTYKNCENSTKKSQIPFTQN